MISLLVKTASAALALIILAALTSQINSFSFGSSWRQLGQQRELHASRKPSRQYQLRRFMTSDIVSSKPPSTVPLNPSSFAGMVEQAIEERFGPGAQRAIESLRLLDQEYEHNEDIVDIIGRNDDINENLSDSSSYCQQYAHSYVPGLSIKTFWDVQEFDWCSKLASNYRTIRKEFLDVTKDIGALKEKGNNIWAGALTEDASSYGQGWSTLVLMNRAIWDPVNVNLFPKTAKAIRDTGVPATEVFFASMKPHTDIKKHSDFTNFVLTSHLAVDIPESGNNKCRLRVGDDTRQWINGEVMLFDTSIMHDAVNEADDTRYILMFRVWHPDLTEVERNALQFIYDCLQVPELVSTDPEERFKAELELNALKQYPVFKNSGTGFGGSGGKTKANKSKKQKKR